MTLTYKTPEQLQQMTIEAHGQEKAAKAALIVDGRQMYAPEEHERRVNAIEETRRQTIAEVQAEVTRRIAEVQEQLQPVVIDPVTTLKGEDLNRASALAVFVREDIERGDFAPKLRAVIKSGDKAAQAVWLRYLSVRDERGLPRWNGEVQEMVKQLEAIVRPPDTRQDDLRARQKALHSVMSKELTTRYIEQAYGRR